MPSSSPAPSVVSNADLHSHSTFSDGTLSPTELATRAKDNGVNLWALTDHDEVAGLTHARQAAQALELPFLTGVEISVSYAGKTVHIVGLGFDDQDLALLEGLNRTRGGREARAQQIAAGLAAVGIEHTYEGALEHAGNPDLVARSHFARHLIERGICRDFAEVFQRFMTQGKPGFVPHHWASLRDCVHWIRDAGGIAVIAHPGRYGFSDLLESAFFSDFIAHGGQAVEVVTGSHSPAEYIRYAELARQFKLAVSRGSDFHCPHESRIDLGALPALPTDLQPVWDLLLERIQ